MHTTLLLGAGASAFAGIPTTVGLVKELRKRVASIGDQYERPMARFFMSNLLIETNPTDIEDLYEYVDRMVDAEEMHRIVIKCKAEAQSDSKLQFGAVASPSYMSEEAPLAPLIEETNDIDNTIAELKSIKLTIRDMLLEKCMTAPEARGNIKVVYDDVLKPLGIRDVLTTNYDNVIETYSEEARIPLANGFVRSFHGDRREWTGKFEEAITGALRLVKMHGSVTWQRDGDAVLELGRPGARGEEYDVMVYPEKGPKMYDKGIFPDLRRKFREVLAATDLLLVIGYSFRDEGINRMIKRRLAESDHNESMMLLYVDPDSSSGIMRLLGKEANTKPVTDPTSGPLAHSTPNIPYVYTDDIEFGPGTSRWIASSVDEILRSTQ